MSITTEEYSQALLNAEQVNSDAGYDLVVAEKRGCTVDWSKALCNSQKIDAGFRCLQNEDMTSETCVLIYNDLVDMAGSVGGVVLDPNSQVPDNVTVITNPVEAEPTPIIPIARDDEHWSDQVTYVNDELVKYGLTYQVMYNNGNRFLDARDGFERIPTGGFTTNPDLFILQDGEILYVIN